MKKILINVITLLVVICEINQASASLFAVGDSPATLTIDVIEEYNIGDGDTFADAKKMNMDAVKKEAAEYAGTYVEQKVEVNNNKVTRQQVMVLTAGFVEVLNQKHTRKINGSGGVVLVTKATVKLDKKAIKDGLDKLKTDPVRAKKITALEKDNARLRDSLYSLTKEINNSSSRNDLVVKRDKILDDLNKNRVAAKNTFTKGTLFQLAMINSSEYDIAKEDVDNNFFGAIKNETVVNMGAPKFVPNDKGNYDVYVDFTWKMPHNINSVLDKYLTGKNIGYHTDVFIKEPPYSYDYNSWDNEGAKAKKVYSEKLYKYLVNKVVMIEIDLGAGAKGYLPIASHFNSSYVFKYQTLNATEKQLIKHTELPLVINNVSRWQLEKATEIKANVIIVDYKEATKRVKEYKNW